MIILEKTPEISVIMSVYNGEKYLAEAIESLINQSFSDWELVVIDDCSTDSTGEILRHYSEVDGRIIVHTNETNLKLPSSLNKAIALSRGKYIARMDADDICMPERFEKQYDFMKKNPDIALSSCRFLTLKNGVYSSGGCGGRCDSDAIRAMLLTANPILHPGVIAKADVMKELMYDTSLTCTEDLELWTRMADKNLKMQILPEYLLIYRLHDKQITSTTLERQHSEVVKIQTGYLEKLTGSLSEDMKRFYITGIYFRENPDTEKFREFFDIVRNSVTKKNQFKKSAVYYAFFEVLAEYRRNGVAKADILKLMSAFGWTFAVKELFRRKKAASRDGRACIKAAEKLGLVRTGGSDAFPSFEKHTNRS